MISHVRAVLFSKSNISRSCDLVRKLRWSMIPIRGGSFCFLLSHVIDAQETLAN